jgi:hypothetical protein
LKIGWKVSSDINKGAKLEKLDYRHIPESFSLDYVTNEKVKLACKGLLPNIQRLFLELQSNQDQAVIADFIIGVTSGRMYLQRLERPMSQL